MPSKKTSPLIKYTSRDYTSIREDLIAYADQYYPGVVKDKNDGSFASLMLDVVSYVGDNLSFYLDYSANESFLDTSVEYDNLLKHGKALGYKFQGNPSALGIIACYVTVPADPLSIRPDSNYIPLLKQGSQFSSDAGNVFVLTEDIDFSNNNNEIVVASVDPTSGVPTSYAIKAEGQIVSGELLEETIEVGAFQRFLRIEIGTDNVTEIISIFDEDGNEYFEVPYLSQNVIYKALTNKASDKDRAPSILKPIIVPRRFVTEQERDSTFIQFGYGSENEILKDSVAEPTDVVLRRIGKEYVTDQSFDPAKLVSTDKFGVAPSNTVLTVIYRRNSTDDVNSGVGTIVNPIEPLFEFDNIVNLDATKINDIVSSIECENEEAVIGDITLPDSDELKIRIYDNFATQNRAVTKQDYISMVYRMPAKFGAVKRANIIQDKQSFKRNLNLYVISEDQAGTLVKTSDSIKLNLKTWLSQYKMINDTLDILDAKIINLGIEFEILADPDKNRFDVLQSATERLQERYLRLPEISEPFSITEVYRLLREVDDVLDVLDINIVPMIGSNYSNIRFNIELNKDPSGRFIDMPANVIWEIKFPGTDIKGIVK